MAPTNIFLRKKIPVQCSIATKALEKNSFLTDFSLFDSSAMQSIQQGTNKICRCLNTDRLTEKNHIFSMRIKAICLAYNHNDFHAKQKLLPDVIIMIVTSLDRLFPCSKSGLNATFNIHRNWALNVHLSELQFKNSNLLFFLLERKFLLVV